jgi:hypothetical protein
LVRYLKFKDRTDTGLLFWQQVTTHIGQCVLDRLTMIHIIQLFAFNCFESVVYVYVGRFLRLSNKRMNKIYKTSRNLVTGDGIWIFQYDQEGKQELPEFSRPDMQ